MLFFFVFSVLAKKPNILFILTDDQAPHTLSSYGNKVCQTPHIDKWASSGMVLDQAYHMGSMSGAVCSPSRTMIMSGRTLCNLPPRGKKHRKQEEGRGPRVEILQNTLPAVFNRAGYETFRTCKNGNSYGLANELFQIVKDKSCRNADEDSGSQWHGSQVLSSVSYTHLRAHET